LHVVAVLGAARPSGVYHIARRGLCHRLFGLFTLIYGFSQITMGIELRHASKTVDSAMNNVA
jgi:hypothetical protein